MAIIFPGKNSIGTAIDAEMNIKKKAMKTDFAQMGVSPS